MQASRPKGRLDDGHGLTYEIIRRSLCPAELWLYGPSVFGQLGWVTVRRFFEKALGSLLL